MSNRILMMLNINPGSGTPIYRQLIEQMERMIMSGSIKPGDELPSIREIASHFEVNQMTISKAYSLMEAKNMVIRQRGKKMTVNELPSSSDRFELIQPAISELLNQAKQLQISDEDLLNELRKQMETKDGK